MKLVCSADIPLVCSFVCLFFVCLSITYCKFWLLLIGDIKVEVREVAKELDGVTEWLLLGLYLGLPCSRLKEIEADYPMTRSRRTEVIYTWMKRERPSWQKVVDALVGVGEGERARNLASKYGN